MNTPHADLAKFARFTPLPVTPDFALEQPGVGAAADDDEDWLEFLSIGARIDPTDTIVGSGWRHAPVLLSY